MLPRERLAAKSCSQKHLVLVKYSGEHGVKRPKKKACRWFACPSRLKILYNVSLAGDDHQAETILYYPLTSEDRGGGGREEQGMGVPAQCLRNQEEKPCGSKFEKRKESITCTQGEMCKTPRTVAKVYRPVLGQPTNPQASQVEEREVHQEK